MIALQVELFHVHTYRCKHAEDVADRAYIEKAIELGAKGIWFTDHAPFPGDPFGHRMDYDQLPEYLDTLSQLKDEYKDRINVHIGMEIEFFPSFDRSGYYRELKADGRIELLLLGQHMAEDTDGGYSFNWDKELLKEREAPALCEAICEGIESGYFDVIAHPDRIFRRSKQWSDDMTEMAERIITASRKKGIILEQNESSKQHKHQYWNEFWDINGKRCVVVRGLDAHFLEELHMPVHTADQKHQDEYGYGALMVGEDKDHPFPYDLTKVRAYLKATGKTLDDCTYGDLLPFIIKERLYTQEE